MQLRVKPQIDLFFSILFELHMWQQWHVLITIYKWWIFSLLRTLEMSLFHHRTIVNHAGRTGISHIYIGVIHTSSSLYIFDLTCTYISNDICTFVSCSTYVHVSWLKVTSKTTYVHFPCTSSEWSWYTFRQTVITNSNFLVARIHNR